MMIVRGLRSSQPRSSLHPQQAIVESPSVLVAENNTYNNRHAPEDLADQKKVEKQARIGGMNDPQSEEDDTTTASSNEEGFNQTSPKSPHSSNRPINSPSKFAAAHASSISTKRHQLVIDKPLMKQSETGTTKHVTFSEVVVVSPLRRDASSSLPFITANGMTVVPGSTNDSEAATRSFVKVKGYVHKRQPVTWFLSIEWTVEYALMLVLIGSFVETFVALEQCMSANNCGEGFAALAVSLGAVSVAVVGPILAWIMWISGRISRPEIKDQVDGQVFSLVFGLLSFWWVTGTLILSVPVAGPFFGGNNAFFISWGVALLCLALFGIESKEIGWFLKLVDAEQRGRSRYLMMVSLLMLGVLVSSAGICATTCSASKNQALIIFALVWSVASLGLGTWLFDQWKEISQVMYGYVCFFLAAEITLGVAVVTVLGPFNRFGGALGFFCAWGALILVWAAVFSKDPRGY